MHLHQLVSALALQHVVTAVATAMDWAVAANNPHPTPPSQDAWYSATAGYEKMSPGTILRIRPTPGNLTSATANCSCSYNILFRTTDSYNQPTFAVTTIFIPAKRKTSPPLLSYQIPYNTADVNGSPSYNLYQTGYADIPAALGEGWVVSVPDFEGPRASFLLGITEGHAVLDSVRAALSLSDFGLSVNLTKTALWGYSGGSIASTFALELQGQYAQELKLHGAAIGGIVASFSATVPLANGGPQAGLLPAAFLGLTSQSTTARQLLESSLFPNNASQFLSAEHDNLLQWQAPFSRKDITSYFANYTAFLFAPEIRRLQRDNWHLGLHGIPRVPMFIYKAIEDELAPVQLVDDLVHRWCSLEAVDARYERNRIGGHAAEYQNGAGRATRFLASVLDGTADMVPVNGGCTILDVTVGSDVEAA